MYPIIFMWLLTCEVQIIHPCYKIHFPFSNTKMWLSCEGEWKSHVQPQRNLEPALVAKEPQLVHIATPPPPLLFMFDIELERITNLSTKSNLFLTHVIVVLFFDAHLITQHQNIGVQVIATTVLDLSGLEFDACVLPHNGLVNKICHQKGSCPQYSFISTEGLTAPLIVRNHRGATSCLHSGPPIDMEIR